MVRFSFKYCLSDPGLVDLETVCNIIVDQSLKDQVFSKEAGRMCFTIVQVKVYSEQRLIKRRRIGLLTSAARSHDMAVVVDSRVCCKWCVCGVFRSPGGG